MSEDAVWERSLPKTHSGVDPTPVAVKQHRRFIMQRYDMDGVQTV